MYCTIPRALGENLDAEDQQTERATWSKLELRRHMTFRVSARPALRGRRCEAGARWERDEGDATMTLCSHAASQSSHNSNHCTNNCHSYPQGRVHTGCNKHSVSERCSHIHFHRDTTPDACNATQHLLICAETPCATHAVFTVSPVAIKQMHNPHLRKTHAADLVVVSTTRDRHIYLCKNFQSAFHLPFRWANLVLGSVCNCANASVQCSHQRRLAMRFDPRTDRPTKNNESIFHFSMVCSQLHLCHFNCHVLHSESWQISAVHRTLQQSLRRLAPHSEPTDTKVMWTQ